MYSVLASRYATALFELSKVEKKSEQYLKNLHVVKDIFTKETSAKQFVTSPLIRANDKEKVVKAVLGDKGVPEDVMNFILLLARKGRLELIEEIVDAFQACEDELEATARGTVHSSVELSAKQKSEIEKTISLITKKKVLFKYEQDMKLIGGIKAQIGSLTFDDSLAVHIKNIKDDLTRRAH